jgi:signal transduction histidine kinase
VEEKNLAVGRTTNGTDFGIQGDEDRLLRVVVNLLGNAVKFTLNRGAIMVGLADRGAEIELTVRDTGIGIPQSELARIFDPYQQAHHGRGGSGLGLAIVKGLVEAHGGQVSVESQEGQGSTFAVRLPRDGRPPAERVPTGETAEVTR